MFGLGPSELVMVFLLVLLLFGPSKLPQMAKDLGRFVGEARRSIDEFKDELTSAGEDEKEDNSPRKSKKNSSVEDKEDSEKKAVKAKGSSSEGSEDEEEYDF